MIENFKNTKPQINYDVIQSIENWFNFKLPYIFKKYLVEVNGGIAKKNIFLFPNSSDGAITHHWYGIRSDKYFSFLISIKDSGYRYPKKFVAFCDDTSGNKILLSTSGSDYGKIYYWDHELEADEGEKPDYSNLTLIADSFDEFLSMLKSEAEIEALESSNSC